jgi:hypothetical protein
VCKAWNKHCAGKAAGHTDNHSYLIVSVDHVARKAHRIVWKMMTGEEPPESPDHHDGDSANNRWSNLRPATNQQQKWNRNPLKNNTSGFRGVRRSRERCRKPWRAAIREDGVRLNLGEFDTAEEASVAYETAARRIHGEFYRAAAQPQPKERQR